MIVLNYTVLVQIVAFLAFWFLLARLLFKPFVALLEERERRTEGARAEAAVLLGEAGRMREEYEKRVAGVREEAGRVKEATLEQGRGERERLLSRAREEAAALLERTRGELNEEMRRQEALVGREAEAIAREMAEKVLGRKIA